jgi:hypothetical protein
MRAYQIVSIIVIALALPASAQQSDRSLRHQIESVVSSYAENFNKQNASGIAGLYTKDGVLVTPAGPENLSNRITKMHSKPGSIIKI